MVPYVDLFCGCGGASVGLTRAGWRCVGAVDVSEDALAIYAANFSGHATHRIDLSTPLPVELVAEWRTELREGVVWASSPCTGFSLATRRPRLGTRSLTLAVADHVAALRPRVLLFENVPIARNCDEFKTLVEALRADGYAVAHAVVNVLVSLGLAQTRKRLVMVARRVDEDEVARTEVVREVARKAAENELEARLHQAFAHTNTGAGRTELTHTVCSMRACFASAGLSVPCEFIYFQTPDEKRKRSIYSLDEPGPTIRGCVRPFRPTYKFTARDATHDASRIFAAECVHMAALQGFPPEYTWIGCKTAVARSIGNAVPPPLATALAGLVATYAMATPWLPASAPSS